MTKRGLMNSLFNRDLSFSVASQVFVSGFNFLVGVAAARLLGVADFGLFTLILMVSGLTATAQAHLLTVPMMTLAGQRSHRSASYFSVITVLSFGFSVLAGLMVAGMMAAIFLLRGDPIPFDLITASAVITTCQNHQLTVRMVMFARRLRANALTMDILRLVLMVVIAIILTGNGYRFDVAGVCYLLGASAGLASIFYTWRLLQAPVRRRLLVSAMRRHWPLSQWMLLMMLVSTGQEQAIWVFVGIELGDAAIGGLRAGQYLLGLTHIVVMALEYYLPRNAAEELSAGGVPALRTYLMQQMTALGGVALLLIVLIAIYAEESLSIVFGSEYAAFADITRIYAMTYLVMFIRSIWTAYLRAIETTRSIFTAHLISSITAVLLIYPMMWRFGIEGVAYCILIVQTVCLGVVVFEIIRSNAPAAPTAHSLTKGQVQS